MNSPELLFVSTYESYLQPTLLRSLGTAAAKWGVPYKLVDLAVEALDEADLAAAKAFVITVPLFDSIRPACAVAGRLRAAKPTAPVFFVGAHAALHGDVLESDYHGCIIRDGAVGLRKALERLGIEPSAAAHDSERPTLPPLQAYTYPGGLLSDRTIANVETTVGCRFGCTHCSVYALLRGRVQYTSVAQVITQIREMVDQGADHVTFMDAEFMNDAEHGPAVVEAMHREFPDVGFDLTTRVDRILKYEEKFRRFFDLGCAFVTTAIEFPDDEVLQVLRKGYRTADLARLADLIAHSGFRICPTLVVFSPWIDLPRIHRGESFLTSTGLDRIIDPVQRSTRLIVNKGSALLDTAALKGVQLIEREFSYDWVHPDPAVDALYAERVAAQCQIESFKRCCVRC